MLTLSCWGSVENGVWGLSTQALITTKKYCSSSLPCQRDREVKSLMVIIQVLNPKPHTTNPYRHPPLLNTLCLILRRNIILKVLNKGGHHLPLVCWRKRVTFYLSLTMVSISPILLATNARFYWENLWKLLSNILYSLVNSVHRKKSLALPATKLKMACSTPYHSYSAHIRTINPI